MFTHHIIEQKSQHPLYTSLELAIWNYTGHVYKNRSHTRLFPELRIGRALFLESGVAFSWIYLIRAFILINTQLLRINWIIMRIFARIKANQEKTTRESYITTTCSLVDDRNANDHATPSWNRKKKRVSRFSENDTALHHPIATNLDNFTINADRDHYWEDPCNKLQIRTLTCDRTGRKRLRNLALWRHRFQVTSLASTHCKSN